LDRVVTVGASFSIAMPPMWLAALLISTFAVQRNWLPSQGYVPVSQGWWKWLQHLLLPGFTMAFVPAAEIALQLKSGLVDSLRRDYITASRAKGMRGVTIGCSAIVDSIFLMNGLGSLVLEATRNKDIPILLGFIILTTVVTILINVLVDISYGYFNPKVRT
jgi:peptide/nickel transport system permease protein